MSSSFYKFWLPISIIFHAILFMILNIAPISIPKQDERLNIISVSWEMVKSPKTKIISTLSVNVPKDNNLITTPQKKVGKYWSRDIKNIGVNKNLISINKSVGKLDKGKFVKVMTSPNGKLKVPEADPDNYTNSRYGEGTFDNGNSASVAKLGGAGAFLATFTKNEEDFSMKFQIIVKQGIVNSVKILSGQRNDRKDNAIASQILSGIVPVNPACKYDKMILNINVTNGNRCNYIWE